MADPFNRIEEHLGTALQRLSLLQTRVARGADTSRELGRCLSSLQEVAQQVDDAFIALKHERARLRAAAEEAEATMRRARKLFVESPNACLVLNRDGAAITDANAAASRLLNVSPRHLIGKPFTIFLQQDRDIFLQQLRRTAEAAADQWQVRLRPRERAMVQVLVTAIADNGDTAAILLTPAANAVPEDGGLAEYAEV
jgi:PAS domain-containing protein